MTAPARILHVDDDPDFVEMVGTFIEREDERFIVETATDATEALDYLADNDVHCIVSDYEMPGENGIEFLQRVREDAPDLPFILFTGKGSEEVASEAISAGVTDYLQKEVGNSQYTVLANRVGNAIDQYRTRQAVAEAEEKLSQLAEKTEDILFMFDGDWSEILFVNSAYEDVWGGSIAELRNDPRSFVEYIHPDDREEVIRVMERISNGESDEIEYRLVHPDGERRWVRVGTKPIFDEEGSVSRIVGFVRDITERKVREEELQRLKEQFQTFTEHRSDLITVIDTTGEIQYQSPAIEPILGYGTGELLGENAFEYIHPDDRDGSWEAFAETVEHQDTATERFEYRFKHADGSWIWLETVGSNRTSSALDGFVLTSREISERKEHERHLKALNETSQHLMGADTRELVAEIGVNSASDILGPDSNEIRLHDDERSDLVPVAQTATAEERANGPPAFSGEDRLAREVYERGDARIWDAAYDDAEASHPATSIRSELFLPINGYGVLIAASETAEAFDPGDVVLGEILVSTIATALEQVEQTEQLRAREWQLRRQNDRLEEFTSVVSHDLRNPLQVARGRTELLMEDCESEHIEHVSRALDRMETLINDLLTLAREGDLMGELELVDLGTLSANCWQNVETNGGTLDVSIDRAVHADESRLQQLFENLMRNAVEHGGEGVTVTVGDLEDGFYVEDDGPGISVAHRDDVFDTGYSTAVEGTGFGLSIVKQVVEAHGWSVRVDEGADGGARFEIRDTKLEQP